MKLGFYIQFLELSSTYTIVHATDITENLTLVIHSSVPRFIHNNAPYYITAVCKFGSAHSR